VKAKANASLCVADRVFIAHRIASVELQASQAQARQILDGRLLAVGDGPLQLACALFMSLAPAVQLGKQQRRTRRIGVFLYWSISIEPASRAPLASLAASDWVSFS